MCLDERGRTAPVALEGFEDYRLEKAGVEVGKGCFGEVGDQEVFVLIATGFESSRNELDSLG